MRPVFLLGILFASAFLIISVSAQECTIDVFGLDVSGNTIKGKVRNTGDINQSISYGIFVNDAPVLNESINLTPGSLKLIEKTHSFDTGEYKITLNASSGCGGWDSENMWHLIFEKYECENPHGLQGENRCDYASRQFQVCSNGAWNVVAENDNEYCWNCPSTCGDGACNCGETISSCYMDCIHGSCSQGYLDEYQCRESTLQRKYRYANCTTEWRDLYACVYGCAGGQCESYPGLPGCSVTIESLDHTNNVLYGRSTYTTSTVKNTGNITTLVNLTFFLDGQLREYYKKALGPGSSFVKTFNFNPGRTGSHSVKLNASARCGYSDARSFTLNVVSTSSSPACNNNNACEPFRGETEENCPADCGAARGETNVSIYPNQMDITLYTAKVVSVDIVSGIPQEFSISVSGIPEEWLSYSDRLDVARSRVAYIYITPQKIGHYNLSVNVHAVSESLDFGREIPVYVAPVSSEDIQKGILGQVLDFISGIFSFLATNLIAFALILIIIIVILIYIGHNYLRIDIF